MVCTNSDDKKAEYLLKRSQARAKKKAATLICANCQQVSQDQPSSFLSPQRTPLSNITNTHKSVSTAASCGNTAHQPAESNVECKKTKWGVVCPSVPREESG